MSKLQTRNAFSNTSLQDSDLFWIEVDLGGGIFESQKITGLQLKTILSQDPIVNDVVLIDQNTPTTGGVTFNPNTPLTQDILYLSTTNGSTWIYNGSAYVTYVMPVTSTTPFNIYGSSVDAGGNKTTSIQRTGDIFVGTNSLNSIVSASTGLSHTANGFTQVSTTTYSDTYYPIIRQTKRRGTQASSTPAQSGDILGTHSFNSNGDAASITVKATETHGLTTRGSEIILSNCANGSATQVENLKIQQDGKLKVSNAYTLPATAPTSGKVLGYSSAGVSDWLTLDKTSVGLGNVANIDTTNASNISSGTLATARMGSGTADSSTYLRGDGAWATVSSGGLTKFTEAESTSTPNATVYVDSLTANGSATDVDVTIKPKGAGAFQLAIPDNTTTGGNKRGQYAVDLQMSRNANTQVASGNYSFIAGQNNTASGTHCLAVGQNNTTSGFLNGLIGYGNTINNGGYSMCFGYNNTSNNSISSFCIGQGNISSGVNYSGAMGIGNTSSGGNGSMAIGYGNTASGGNGSMAIGFINTSSGDSSVAIGSRNTSNSANSLSLGNWGSSNSIINKISFGNRSWGDGSSYQNAPGVLQSGKIMYSAKTTDATTTTLTTDQTTASATNQLTLINNQAIRFKGTIIGKQNSNSVNVGVWDIDGVIVRGNGAGTTTLVIGNVNVVTNTSSWGTPTLSANTTTGCLTVNVIGLGATTIGWFANLELTEVAYT